MQKNLSVIYKPDTIISLILLVLSLWVYWYAGFLITENAKPIAAHTFPRALSVMLFVLSSLLCFQSLLQNNHDTTDSAHTVSGLSQNTFIMVMIASLVIYALLLPAAGFIISSLIVMAAWLWLLGIRHYLLLTGFTVSVVMVVYTLFRYVLNVPLP